MVTDNGSAVERGGVLWSQTIAVLWREEECCGNRQ